MLKSFMVSSTRQKPVLCVTLCRAIVEAKEKKKKKTGFGKLESKNPLHVPTKRTHKQVLMLNILI